MRVALCFSGLVRTYRQTYENFVANLIEPNKHHLIDTFISTWPTEHSNNSMEWTRRLAWYQERAKPFPENPIDYADLQAKYSPTIFQVERPIVFDESWYTDTPGINIQSLRSMTYKIHSADVLRRQYELVHGFQYDVVVRIRFDTLLPLPIVIDTLDLNVLFVPSMMQPKMYHEKDWVNDKFAIGNRDLIGKYCDWHNNFVPLIQRGEPIQPETLLWAHLQEKEVPYHPWGCEMEMVRLAGH